MMTWVSIVTLKPQLWVLQFEILCTVQFFPTPFPEKRGNFGLRKILGYITKEPEMVR